MNASRFGISVEKIRKVVSVRNAALFLFFMLLIYCSLGAYRILKWKAHMWLPEYIATRLSPREEVEDSRKHIIFTFVDHYEPGYDEAQAVANHTSWMKLYRKATQGHVDSYGNRLKYSWFYPYDQRIDNVLVSLTEAVHEGIGEVELHWHHLHSNNTLFPKQLEEAIRWFSQYGALQTCGEDVRTAFSFIHGNWALDDSGVSDEGKRFCGVTREIDILFNHGCYADFTFSTINTDAQPTGKINSIYYVTDTDERKSHNDGEPVKVGHRVDDKLMIIEGPLGISPFEAWRLEYGALERYAPPNKNRLSKWIDANIHVEGRPDWVFVKLYSHGIQSPEIMRDYFGGLLTEIESLADTRKFKFHYMSARETYNVIKAAEYGKAGNPEQYRDFLVPKPCNYFFHTNVPGKIEKFVDGKVLFQAF